MSVELFETANGITTIVDRMPHLESASVGAWIKVGSRSETECQHGITHLLEHMAFKGTRNRSAREIVEEIESVGGELNASTNVEHTTYFARVLKEDVGLALDILSDLIMSPVIDPMELDREKHVVLQEIGANLDSPEDLAYDIFQQTAWPGQPIGRSVLGTPDSIRAQTPDAIRKYMDSHYRGPNMLIVVAGSVDSEMVARQIEECFDRLPGEAASPNPAARYVGGECLERKDLQEVQVLLGFEGVPFGNDDALIAQILASVLGGGMSSRLFQEVREERGLCYFIYAFHWAFEDTGLFAINAATGSDDAKALMPVILDELKKVSTDITEEEVDRARAQVKASLMMALESPVARSNQLARQFQAYGRVLKKEEIIEKLNSINASRLQNLATSMISSGRPTLSAVGPVGNLMTLEEVAGNLAGNLAGN